MSSRLGLLTVLAVACAMAWPMQGSGSLQNAHYALVRALAEGTVSIDATIGRVGEVATNDVALVAGVRYSNKPPGLAFATFPLFAVLDAAGVEDHTRILWGLGLLGVVAPAAGIALLVGLVAERLAPGGGAVAGVVAVLGTLLLPFATLFVHHALAGFLALAAFALLLGERGALRLAAAGALAGAAITTEYSAALVAAILTLYVARRSPRPRRLAAWCLGVGVGVLPLLVYNAAAFGSPFRTSYSVDGMGRETTLFGRPSLDTGLELLASTHGLLVLTPVLAAAAFGLGRLYLDGRRAEALVLAGVPLASLVFNSAFYSPFGGFSAGPRYLVVAGAFLAVGLAPAWLAAPFVTGALACASAAAMLLLTATRPQAGYDWAWLDRLGDGEVPLTALSLVGVTGWYAILPLFALGGIALALAARAAPPGHVGPLEPLAAGAALAAWAVVALTAPETGREGDHASYAPAALAVGVAVACVLLLRARAPRLARASG